MCVQPKWFECEPGHRLGFELRCSVLTRCEHIVGGKLNQASHTDGMCLNCLHVACTVVEVCGGMDTDKQGLCPVEPHRSLS